jgi:hypothetical protein
MRSGAIKINRAPVMTLWAAVVARHLGFTWDEALTMGRAVAGLNAHAKGLSLGIFRPTPKALSARRKALKDGAKLHVDLLHRAVPVVRTPAGLRAASKGRAIDPQSVKAYLEGRFGDALGEATAAMQKLARALPPGELAARAYALYVKFRPSVPAGAAGWGAAGVLSLKAIARAAD